MGVLHTVAFIKIHSHQFSQPCLKKYNFKKINKYLIESLSNKNSPVDNILETLLCSFCHKYLSVKPVKVYPNRLIQCGRCIDNKEQSIQKLEAVESLYGIIAENILFKCVNRFDGCRELLTYSQVRDHEQICLQNIQKCPICYEVVATFMMLRHFHSKHKNAILDCPALLFNLNDHLEMPSAYIYQEEDNLFFLYISYSKSENTIKLDLVYMGSYKLAKNIYYQFTVSSEKKEFDIVLIPKSCSNDCSVVDISHMSNLILIKFKLIDRNLKVLTAYETSNAAKRPIPKKQISVTQNALQGTINRKFSKELNLKCMKCQEYCILSLTSCPIQTYCFVEDNNYLCYYCYQWFRNKQMLGSYFQNRFPNEIISGLKFSKWNCSDCCSDIQFSDVQSHEINCKQGRQFSCPIENCSEKGTANQMIEHLKVHNCLAFSAHFEISSFNKLKSGNTTGCYVFLKEHIVHLRLRQVSGFHWGASYFVEGNSYASLVTKPDYDKNKKETTLKPYVMFFDSRNTLFLQGCVNIQCQGIFIKVIVI